MNILILHNTSSVKEEDGTKIYYPYSQDLEIIRTIKKLPYNITSVFYEAVDVNKILKDYDLVINLCDAYQDPEDEHKIISNLEKNKIAYTGCSSQTSKLCQNKFAFKNVLKLNKIPTPEGQLFKDVEEKLNDDLKFPLILKPIGEDGSNGIDEDSAIFNEEQLRKKLSELFSNFKNGVLVEEYLNGREFNVPIIGNENPVVMPILEIDYSKHFEGKPRILTYKAKWSKNSNDFKNTYSDVAKLDKNEEEKIKKLALSAYKAAGCTGYGSVDLRMNDYGNVFVIEVNPNCYIAPEADIVKAAKSINISYEELLDKIINYAIERFSLQKELAIIN